MNTVCCFGGEDRQESAGPGILALSGLLITLKCEAHLYLELPPLTALGCLRVVTGFPALGVSEQHLLDLGCPCQPPPWKVIPHGHSASCLCRENFLVLDVFFEALTSEALEQRAAYGLSALLGETRLRFHGRGSAGPAPSDPLS